MNLIIGRNDCGKTAFMEAVQLIEDARDPAYHLLRMQTHRLGRGVKRNDLERFWRPMFLDLDAKAGFQLSMTRDDGTSVRLELRQGTPSEEIILEDSDGRTVRDGDGYEASVRAPAWALDVRLHMQSGGASQQRIVPTPNGVKLPPMSNAEGEGSYWIMPRPVLGELEVGNVSTLKQRGEDGLLVELLRDVDPRLSGIELLAPSGGAAELFVRLSNGTPMLPLALMGDGFQRCVEIGAAAATHDWPTLFIDEIENGMHHLVLQPLWQWLATIARRRNLQVFATTHSEECIHAACRAFQTLDDDGLRVIRLDRLEHETRATIYDRALVETAERTGTEIRG